MSAALRCSIPPSNASVFFEGQVALNAVSIGRLPGDIGAYVVPSPLERGQVSNLVVRAAVCRTQCCSCKWNKIQRC